MKKILFIAAILSFLLYGCSAGGNKNAGSHESDEIIDVEILISPEKIELNKEITLKAVVTQGKDHVEDAQEVKFEVWDNGNSDDKHEFLEAKHKDKGVYTAKKTFSKDGIYSIVAHVTARDMHNMPKIEVPVGKGAAGEENQKAEEEHPAHQHDGAEDKHATSQDHHGHGSVAIDFEPGDNLKANEEVRLSAQIENDGSPLAKAEVRYEIYKSKAEGKHEFIIASEAGTGNYTAAYKFNEAGSYIVVVHVQNDELHEHAEYTVEVK